MESSHVGGGHQAVLVELLAEGDGFFESDVEAHVDAGLFLDVHLIYIIILYIPSNIELKEAKTSEVRGANQSQQYLIST